MSDAGPSARELHGIAGEARRLAVELAPPDEGRILRKGHVTATADGPPQTATVDLGSSGSPVPGVRIAGNGYVAGVGHYVYVIVDGPAWLIIGKVQ